MIPLQCAPSDQIEEALFQCCGCRQWAHELNTNFPFSSLDALQSRGDELWWELPQERWLEAFSHHPRIGDLESLKKKYAATESFTSREQGGVSKANPNTLLELQQRNIEYEAKFGFVFLVCATGKTAEEMLNILNSRISNSPETEIRNAAGEQVKITHIRLKTLFGGNP